MKRVLLLLYFAFFLQRTLSPMGIPCIYLHIEICRYIIYIYISKQILSRNSCWREISIASVCSALPLLSDSFSTMICYLSIPSQPIRDWCISNKSISLLFLQFMSIIIRTRKKKSAVALLLCPFVKYTATSFSLYDELMRLFPSTH